MKKEKPSFEEALKRLEQIVGRLENPEVPLGEGFALFEEGMSLSAGMKHELNEIEKKVKLLQRNSRGETEETDLPDEDETLS
jgi:exodeoxyribonuclease VII small subunit